MQLKRDLIQGRSHCEGGVGEWLGCHAPTVPPLPNSISERNSFQKFQFQTSEILLLTGAQKLYEPEISRFSPCMLQVLDNIRRLLIFSNYKLLSHCGPSEIRSQ